MLIKTTSISLLLATVAIFNACSSDLFNQTPKCSDSGVVDTLVKRLNSSGKKTTIDIDMIRQIGLNEQNGMRTCQTSVDYAYSVDEEGSLIGQAIDGFRMGVVGTDGASNNHEITYTVVLGETGKKYIVRLQAN